MDDLAEFPVIRCRAAIMQLSSAEIVSLSAVNHHNYSLDQEKHQDANGISGLGINIQQEGISGNGDQTDGSLRNALTSGEECSSSSLGKMKGL